MGKVALSEITPLPVYDLLEAMDEDEQEWLPLQAEDDVHICSGNVACENGKIAENVKND